MKAHKVLFLTVACIGLGLAPLSVSAATLYVDDDNCPGPGSGTQGDPYCSIQTAIDNAVDTDEIVVAPGEYEVDQPISFLGKSIVVGPPFYSNVLIPLADERTPLTDDPEVAAIVNRMISAYPDEPPNRTDIERRMLNTNSPQKIDNDVLGGQLFQNIAAKDSLVLRYDFLTQKVRAFQFVKGQNPDTRTHSHLARATWTRVWSASILSDVSVGFDRIGSLLTPEENFIGFGGSVSGETETWCGVRIVGGTHGSPRSRV